MFACDLGVCAGGVPRISLADGTVLSEYEEAKIVYGKPLELLCTGEAHNLEMTKENVELTIATVNKTIVRFFAERPERQNKYYYCEDVNSKNATGVRVIVDSPPLVIDFRCRSKNLEYLNCTFASLNVCRKLSLYFIMDKIGYKFLLCKLGKYDSMYCLWETKNPLIPYQVFGEKLTFVMETFNFLGCVNQTFVINHDTVIKPDPPKLSLLWKSSRDAALKWKIPRKLLRINYLYLEHRISYWYSGTHQVQVDTTTVKANVDPVNKFELQLPCAGTFYEVRVSVKPKRAVGEEYWSEDAVISFVTDPESGHIVAAVDPACIRPRVPITPEIMLYEIEKFRDRLNEEKKELLDSIRSLKMKLDKINHSYA